MFGKRLFSTVGSEELDIRMTVGFEPVIELLGIDACSSQAVADDQKGNFFAFSCFSGGDDKFCGSFSFDTIVGNNRQLEGVSAFSPALGV